MPRVTENPWEPQIETLRRLWDEGVPIEEICRRLDRSMSAIIGRLAILGISLNRDIVDYSLIGEVDPGGVLLARAIRFASVRVTAVQRAITALEHERVLIDQVIEELTRIKERLRAFTLAENAVEIHYQRGGRSPQ